MLAGGLALGTFNNISSQLYLSTGGNVGIGTTTPAGLLDISKALSGVGTLTGPYLSISSSTYTASSNADMAFNSISAPTLAGSGVQTTTNAYTFYIAGAPTAGTNETITNGYALGVNGNIEIAGKLVRSTQAGITAHSGGGQASAVAIHSDIAPVTTVGAVGDSVALPTLVIGMQLTVVNETATSLNLYPVNGGSDVINGTNSTTAYAVAGNKTAICTAIAANTWECDSIGR